MNASTDWQTALLTLAAGAVMGIIAIFVMWRRKNVERDTEAAAPPATRPALRGFVWGVLSTVVLGGVVYYATTIATASARPSAPPVASAKLPDAIEKQIEEARASLERDDLMSAYEQSRLVLAKMPEEPRALTYNAVVRMAMGQPGDARTMLEKATVNDPQLLDAWVALATARMQTGDPTGATAAIDAAIQQHPEQKQKLLEVLKGLQTRAEKARANAPTAGPAAPSASHPTGRPPTVSTGSEPVHITIALHPGVNQRTGTVFIIARAAGASSGHPLAVTRVSTTEFPVTVDLGDANSMMGTPLPPRMYIEARLDSDGNPGTIDPKDPKASADGVVAGASLSLTLQ